MALHSSELAWSRQSLPRRISQRLDRAHPYAKIGLAIVGGIILLAILWHFLAPLFAHHDRKPAPPPVKVATAQRRNVTMMQQTIGTVVSPQMVQVTAQVTGKLLTANFKEGQLVHKGDTLFQIDPAPYQAAVAQAEGQLAKDTATLANARLDLSRYQVLAQQNAISDQQLKTQAATVQSDEGVVVSDQAAVQTARINLGYTRIVSPVEGKTGPIFIQPGNLITANTTSALVTITQVQPVKVSFMLPQNQLAQIQNQVTAGKLQAVIPMPDAASGKETAPVDFVSNIVSASTGTIELRADFPNIDFRLVPGQTVTIGVALNQIAGATVVPRDAVNLGPDKSFVYVLGKDGKAYSKTVTVLNDDGVTDAIQGDVKPGDKVITDGQLRVMPGQTVRVAAKRKSGPGAKPAAQP